MARLITSLVDDNAERDPSGTAVALPDGRVSHAELRDASLSAARSLIAAGVRRGDHVGILLADRTVEHLALSLGAARLGAVAVCLNARFKSRELGFALANSGIRLLLTSSWFAPVMAEVALPDGCRVVDLDDDDGFAAAAGKVTGDAVEAVTATVRGDDAARVIYTSGTTSLPKACLHTHDALLAQGESVALALRLTAQDRFWTPLTMFHTGGWTPFLAAQSRGAALHHPGRFVAEVAWQQIHDQRCTVLFPGFETIWLDVLGLPQADAEVLDAARLLIIVGVPERLRALEARHPHIPVVSNTGSTECGGFLCMGDPDDDLETRVTTVGRPLEGMSVRIVDPDTGEEVPDGTVGELRVHGPSLLSGYHGDPLASAEAFDADGWFRTGDLLLRRPDGLLSFVSRLKDMLKVGGENVAAAEIEDHLLTHPAVRTVAVVSAPDARYGEVPAAFVQLQPGRTASADELRAHCTGAIATFKVPHHVRFVDDWPMSGTKIRKVELRERIARELAGTGDP